MRLTILGMALAVLALALGPPALAAPHRYAPKHGHPCRHGYRRVKRHHKPLCVKRRGPQTATTAPAPRIIRLHAHLDPSYTRNPLDPFKITYAYSASATQEVSGATLSAAEPAPLPAGVLALYSDGKLECAINVGGGMTGSECPVSYQALGEHRVTTIYSSGEQSATETEVENIGPIATSTALGAGFEEFATPGEVTGPGVQSGWYWIGNLTVRWGAQPGAAHASLDCGEPALETYGRLTASGCYRFNGGGGSEELVAHVYAQGSCEEINSEPLEFEGVLQGLRVEVNPPTTIEPAISWPSIAQLEAGTYHLRATVAVNPMVNNGYAGSEAVVPLQLTPSWTPDWCS